MHFIIYCGVVFLQTPLCHVNRLGDSFHKSHYTSRRPPHADQWIRRNLKLRDNGMTQTHLWRNQA